MRCENWIVWKRATTVYYRDKAGRLVVGGEGA